MKKTLVLTILLLTAASAYAEKDKVYHLYCDYNPPYVQTKKMPAKGLYPDLIRRIMSELGEKLAPIQVWPWARVLKKGLEGEIDGVFSAVKNEERLKKMYYTEVPMITDPWIFWIRNEDRDRLKFSSYEDIKDYRVGVMRGFGYGDEFWNAVKHYGNYEESSDEDRNFRKLLHRRIDYVVSGLNVGHFVLKKLGFPDQIYPLTERYINNVEHYVMFNKEKVSPEFVKKFSDKLREIKQTQWFADLLDKHGHVEFGREN